MPPSRYEYPFDPTKKNNTASSIYRLARDGGTRVLDLGSGPGIVAGALVHLADKEVTCVDTEDDHLGAAVERGVQRTIRADLVDASWSDQLAGEQFDVIVLADVLEHLVEPAATLRLIRERELLARGGHLVISIPNASHIGILAALATGDFPYRPTGLLDATHLRFFTLVSLRRLLEEEGFAIDRVLRTTRTLAKTEFADLVERLSPETLHHLTGQHDETDTYQYVLRVTPIGSAVDELRDDVRRLRRRLDKAESRRRHARRERDDARREADELRRRLDEAYASRTWKVGRTIVGGPAAVARRLRR